MATTFLFQFLFLALFIIPCIFFLITLQNTLKAISPENRKMVPVNVWLMLIPFFNFIWQFILVKKMAQSISAECLRLNIPIKENMPTYSLGLGWSICYLLMFIPGIKGFAAIAVLIVWILYWVKVNQFKNLIIANKDNYMLDAERNIFYGDKAF